MKLGTPINYAGDFRETIDNLADFESAGVQRISVPEAYSFDAVSQLGYIAARTETMELQTGILPMYSRTPTNLAMTAAGLDYISGGRAVLGIGASGPQVIEGFHGVKYDYPVGRAREHAEICRQVWRREKVVHDGKKYQIPLPADQGTGLGKPLKLINHPVRSTIPIVLAALGPKNVELAAEVANGWQPLFFHPEKAHLAWGDALAAGRAKRDPSLGELDVYAGPALAICDEAEVPFYLDLVRPHLALYIGGMGARGKNFYNELACRYGYEDEAARIQDLYLDGKKEEAAAAVPDELVRSVSLIGPAGYVAERVEAFREAGATTLTVVPMALDAPGRLRLVEQFREMC